MSTYGFFQKVNMQHGNYSLQSCLVHRFLHLLPEFFFVLLWIFSYVNLFPHPFLLPYVSFVNSMLYWCFFYLIAIFSNKISAVTHKQWTRKKGNVKGFCEFRIIPSISWQFIKLRHVFFCSPCILCFLNPSMLMLHNDWRNYCAWQGNLLQATRSSVDSVHLKDFHHRNPVEWLNHQILRFHAEPEYFQSELLYLSCSYGVFS